MPKRRLLVTPQANRDLDAAALYLATQESVDLGLRFHAKAEAAFELLRRRPSVGRLREFRNPRLRGIRSWRLPVFTDWLVFYRVDERAILVLRVLHGARDLESLFSAEG